MNLRQIIGGIAMRIPFYGKKLCERTMFTEIGAISGHVSMIDKAIAKERGLEPLSAFERWFMQPRIDSEKLGVQNIFRNACIDVMGEDPYAGDCPVDLEYEEDISRMYGQAIAH